MSIEDELHEARLTIERLNRRCQAMEKQVRLANGRANDAESRLKTMKDKAEYGMSILARYDNDKKYYSGHFALHIGELLAAKEKAEKDLAAVMEGFRTCVIDEGTDACLLAVEDAREQEREKCVLHVRNSLRSMRESGDQVSRERACRILLELIARIKSDG